MTRVLIFAAAVTFCTSAFGQDSAVRFRPDARSDAAPEISLGELTPTPSMWHYLQDRRDFLSTEMAIRRKAAFKAAQRQQRIAAMQWYGYSNARPRAAHTPFSTRYFFPGWTGNDAYDPFRWRTGGSRVIVREAQSDYTLR